MGREIYMELEVRWKGRTEMEIKTGGFGMG
jgi:hypothetical protein